jgi:ERCC4-type nuclease
VNGNRVHFYAPSEPPELKVGGIYSAECERRGVDFIWATSKGLVGCQRKTPNDLVASLADGRFEIDLSKIAQSDLVTAILLIEGKWWWEDPFGRANHMTKAKLQGLTLSVQSRGVMLMTTDSLAETADWLTRIPVWLEREEHSSLLRVPKQRSLTPLQRMLAQIDGCSLVRARAIEEHFAGDVLRWAVTEKQMLGVPGVGPGTVKNLGKVIPYECD